MAPENREAWLGRATERLGEWLMEFGEEVPDMRVSVGFPGGRANRQRTVGQCWATSQSADGVAQIFISPIRGEEETVDILGTLLHEMIHAVDDCESGHRGNFARIAKGMGFIPKLTSSDCRSEALQARLLLLAADLGPIPHAALIQGGRAADEPKKQSTRMIKAECAGGTGYKVRLTQKWIDEYGAPICPCCTVEMGVAS